MISSSRGGTVSFTYKYVITFGGQDVRHAIANPELA